MQTKIVECKKCGTALSKEQIKSKNKYCTQSCYTNSRWGEPIKFGKILTRSKAFIEAAKLCQSGISQAEVARLLGLCPQVITDWFAKYGRNNIVSKRECLYCGKPIDSKKYQLRRKYSTKSCYNKMAYAKKNPERKLKSYDTELRAKGLELYWGGLEGSTISSHLKVAQGTVYSWIHDFGHLRERKPVREVLELLPVVLRLETSKSAREWHDILRQSAPAGDSAPVHIVCGTTIGNAECYYLASIVTDVLKQNPCNGETYAFNSMTNETITTIRWVKGTFICTKQPKARGDYIWADAELGDVIEVRKNEFEYLLSLTKKRGTKPRFT